MPTWKELHDKGYHYATNGDADKAEEFLLEAIKLGEEGASSKELCDSLNCLAVIYHLTDRLDDAKALFQRTIDAAPDSEELGSAFDGMASILCQEDDYDQALGLYARAISECRKHNSQAGVVEVESKLLALMELLGDFSETPVDDPTLARIKEQAQQARRLIGLNGQTSPEEIIETLDRYLEDKQAELIENPDRLVSEENALAEISILLGAMWGEQLIQEFGWLWSSVKIGSTAVLCVVSPDRSLVIFPCHFIASCLFDEEVDCTIMLAFNMMKDGLGDMPANGFENVMDGVFRMDPREDAVSGAPAS